MIIIIIIIIIIDSLKKTYIIKFWRVFFILLKFYIRI